MLRVELGEEVKRRGKWHWTVRGTTLEGLSRQPLLDACRAVKRMDEALAVEQIGLYWPGKDKPSLTCTVGIGAGLTVDESRTPVFAKWKEDPRWPSQSSQ